MTRPLLLFLASLPAALVSPACHARRIAGSRPNIVFMLADDMGWAQPGFNGGNPERTPHIDRLAAEGLRLTQFYTHSVRAPTRGAFLTGRYAFRNWMDWHRNQKPLREEGYTTDLLAAEVDRVIARQSADRPFFLYVPFNAVHGPLNKPPRYADRYDVRSAMLKCLDEALGRIVAAVDEHGFKDNTLIVFTNDNGPVLEAMSKPFRGTKNTTFEGGVRVPCVVRWPGHTVPGSSNDGMMFIADWFATFITLAGGRHEQELPVDAIDMTKMLFGGQATDIAGAHPEIVKRLAARLAEAGNQRPPLGDKPLLMDPPLPYIYGREENKHPPQWLKEAVDKARATQPQTWAPGETPWPQAPRGAHASKQPSPPASKPTGTV